MSVGPQRLGVVPCVTGERPKLPDADLGAGEGALRLRENCEESPQFRLSGLLGARL
ncbi:MAG: hypothetical protein ACPG4T_05405 [Nannocystaceae bacterium]